MSNQIERALDFLLEEDSRFKRYRGILVDLELDSHILDRLNSLRGITVTPVCSGHYREGELRSGAGACRSPSLAFSLVSSLPPERVYKKWKQLENPTRTVEVNAWGGPRGNWVVWSSDEGWRDPKIFGGNPRRYPIERYSVLVKCSFESTPKNVEQRSLW
jgi:hypothetical protein